MSGQKIQIRGNPEGDGAHGDPGWFDVGVTSDRRLMVDSGGTGGGTGGAVDQGAAGTDPWPVELGQTLDANNTQAVTSAEASPGSPWIGGWTETRDEGIVRLLTVLAGSDPEIPGTFTFEFSETGTEVGLGLAPISESRPIGDFDTVRDFDLINAGAFYRVAFEPDSALGAETVFVTTTLRRQDDGAFVRLANQELEESNAAMPSAFAYLKAFDEETGKSFNVRPDTHTIDLENSLDTGLTNGTVETFTVDTATDELIDVAHGLSVGDAVVLTTTDTLPDPLDDVDDDGNEVVYWVESVTADRFKLSADANTLTAINITDTGTGTHSYQLRGQFLGMFKDYSQVGHGLDFWFDTEPPALVQNEWSADGVTVGQAFGGFPLSTSSRTPGVAIDGGLLGTVYVDIAVQQTMIARWRRVRIVNGPTDMTLFSFVTFIGRGSYPGTFLGVDDALSSLSTALLTRAIGVAVNPNNELVNNKAGDFDEDNSSTATLLGGATFTGEWKSTSGFQAISVSGRSDAVSETNGVYVEFADDDAGTNAFPARRETYGVDSVNSRSWFTWHASVGRYYRFVWENGPDDQTFFVVDTFVHPFATETTKSPVGGAFGANTPAIAVRTALAAPDDAAVYRNIGRDGQGDFSLNTHVTDVEGVVRDDRNNAMEAFQSNVSSQSPTQIQQPSMTYPSGMSITNVSDSLKIWVDADPNVDEFSGDVVLPLTEKSWPAHAVYYAIAEDGGGGSQETVEWTVDSTDSSSGVTSPDNVFASDDSRAIFDAVSDTATYSGNVTITESEVTQVLLKMEARKESGAAGETMAFQNTVAALGSGSTGAGVAIPTNTITAVAGHTYFAVIARENVSAALSTVTNTMGFSGFTTIADVSNSGESRITVIRMEGTATSNGVINFFLTAASSYDVTHVMSVSNYGDVQAVDTDQSASTGSFSMTAAGTENGMALGFVACELANVNAPVTNFTTRGQGGSAANDDQTLWVGSRTTPTTTNYSLSGTMDGGTNDDMTGVLITLEPSDALDPIVVISHSEGPTTLTQAVSDTSDAVYEQDITADSGAWDETVIDAMTVDVDISVIGNADLEIDRVWIEVTAASSLIRVTGSWVGIDD